jgi:hypothetical protein
VGTAGAMRYCPGMPEAFDPNTCMTAQLLAMTRLLEDKPMNQPKIRPPSPKNIRDEAEADLEDKVRMPDPGRADVEGAVEANEPSPTYRVMGAGHVALDASSSMPAPPDGGQWPAMPPGAKFDPAQAHAFRASHGAKNRLGQPPQLSEAEACLVAYQTALKAYRDDYAGTRSERLKIPFLEAKQRMIDMGLMKGDV